ncbi:MAG: TcpD family membrane protein [Aminipila sp.]
MKNTLNEKKSNLLLRIETITLMMVFATVPAFADISNIGSNFGNWGMEQIGWAALVVIAFMGLRYMIKKAWVPCLVFFCVGGILLFVIKNPEKLEGIGAVLFGIATK